MASPSVDYRKTLLGELKDDPGHALAYLNAALEEGEDAFLIALKDVVDAKGGVSAVARKTPLHRVSLHKILSEKGNPSLASVESILEALDLRLTVGPRKTA